MKAFSSETMVTVGDVLSAVMLGLVILLMLFMEPAAAQDRTNVSGRNAALHAAWFDGRPFQEFITIRGHFPKWDYDSVPYLIYVRGVDKPEWDSREQCTFLDEKTVECLVEQLPFAQGACFKLRLMEEGLRTTRQRDHMTVCSARR